METKTFPLKVVHIESDLLLSHFCNILIPF